MKSDMFQLVSGSMLLICEQLTNTHTHAHIYTHTHTGMIYGGLRTIQNEALIHVRRVCGDQSVRSRFAGRSVVAITQWGSARVRVCMCLCRSSERVAHRICLQICPFINESKLKVGIWKIFILFLLCQEKVWQRARLEMELLQWAS